MVAWFAAPLIAQDIQNKVISAGYLSGMRRSPSALPFAVWVIVDARNGMEEIGYLRSEMH